MPNKRLKLVPLALLLAVFAPLSRAQTCPTGYAHVTATHLGAATPLVNGELTVSANDATQRQLAFSMSGIGVELAKPKRVPVVNGALTQTLCLPRSDRASVVIGYHFVVRETSSWGGNAVVLDAPNVAITTDEWSLDNYDFRASVNPYTLTPSPVVGPQGPVGPAGPIGPAGPVGPAGANGLASTPQIESLINAALPTGRNLFDPLARFPGQDLDGSCALTARGDHDVTSFIPVAGLTQVTTNFFVGDSIAGSPCEYDANFGVIGTTTYSGNTITVHSGTSYLRAVFNNSGGTRAFTLMVMAGPTVPGTFTAFGYNSPSVEAANIAAAIAPFASATTAPQVQALIEAARPLSVNLIDPARATPGNGIHPDDGTLNPIGGHSATDYINVSEGLPITTNAPSNDLNASFGYAWYDKSKVYISGGQADAPATLTPVAGAFYYRQGINTGAVGTTAMIVQGTTLPSQYVAYGYDDPATAARKVSAAITAANQSPRTLGVFGDSISALFNPYWQTPLAAKLGQTHVFNDARAARTTRDLFENYGTGDGTGTFTCCVGSGANWNLGQTTGHTLAQDVAGVSTLVVFSGTNDAGYYPTNLGTAGDAPSRTGSLAAAYGWAIETLQTANPAMRIVWFTPYQYDPANGHGGANTVAGNTAVVNTIIAECALYGVPVLNLQKDSGINSKNWSVTLGDGLHPTPLGFTNFLIPAMYKFLWGYR